MTDLESEPFWRGLGDHELRLQRCRSCDRYRFPPMPGCPWCGAAEASWEAASGQGTVYSWVRVHRAFVARFADDVPYTVAVVELDEGPRVLGRVEPHATIGDRVTAAFHGGGDTTELRFTRSS